MKFFLRLRVKSFAKPEVVAKSTELGNKMTSISVCIPNFNNAAYLEQCIKSAVEQIGIETEIIVVDDGSTDNSQEIIHSFGGKIQAFILEENIGQIAATNLAVSKASHDYCIILHSDDYMLPNSGTTLARLLDKNQTAGMAAGERVETNQHGEVRSLTPLFDGDYIIPGKGHAAVFIFTSYLPCQVMFRKSLFDRIRGAEPGFIIDLDGLLWFKLALTADVVYTQRKVAAYRVHPGSITSQSNGSDTHILDYYRTLARKIEYGQHEPEVQNVLPRIPNHLAKLTLRYCHEMLAAGHHLLAQRHLHLARFFHEEVIHTDDFQELDAQISSGSVVKYTFGGRPQRKYSYLPPDGSIKL